MKAPCLPSVSPSRKLLPDLQLSQSRTVLSSLGMEQGSHTPCPQPHVAAPMPVVPLAAPFSAGVQDGSTQGSGSHHEWM